MTFQPSAEGVDSARRALWHCATPFLGRKDQAVFPEISPLQTRLSQSLSTRLDGRDINSLDWLSIARARFFSDDDKETIRQIIALMGASDVQQSWFAAAADQANHFIKVLVQGGNRSSYWDVDGPSLSDANGDYTRRLRGILARVWDGPIEQAMLDRCSAVAEIHYLNDQGRLAENLARQTEENAPALEDARTLDFAEYAYGAVVILGHSPTLAEAREGKACSQMTQDKITRCVGLNRARKLAPLYIVCGGSVRPRLTRISEGLSMKKELIERYGIPGHEILVDATSEHTYSNFMNAVLLAREAKMPPGTKLAAFLVPDRYGCEDQYAFCFGGMAGRARNEVFPELNPYFSWSNGKEESSVDIMLKDEDVDLEFLSPILMWKDYTGELGESGH
ncbi:hypothetical protein B0H17DRAFT_1203296 [Mycena rosella]|uniref:DUF218 domain-containing protein n=1 Tax=Mycena rosella TaxID=1033263 RepID=A0AAD7DBR2_MYCRO|nr:hypothetical protein B0H17DRAFT_1203296 [Mycena rosella]